jgi:Flp pilus assembly protein TadG
VDQRIAIVALLRARRGIAALEFALIAPIMVILTLGVVDATRALLAFQQITSAAQQVAEIGTARASVNELASDGNLQVYDFDVAAAASAIYAYIPRLRPDVGGDNSSYVVTVTSVAFTASQNGYTASTAWSAVGETGGPADASQTPFRPCGGLVLTAAGTPPSMSTLPILTTPPLVGLTSLLVVDVQYKFSPLFLQWITGPIEMHRTAYLPPRAATVYIEYSSPASATSLICTPYV